MNNNRPGQTPAAPPTKKELAEMAARRAEVRKEEKERLAQMSINNIAASQALLSMEFSKYLNPQTGEPTGHHITTTAAQKLESLSAIAANCSRLLE